MNSVDGKVLHINYYTSFLGFVIFLIANTVTITSCVSDYSIVPFVYKLLFVTTKLSDSCDTETPRQICFASQATGTSASHRYIAKATKMLEA